MSDVPTEKVCEKCGGSGKLLVDEVTHRMCVCLYNRKMRMRLGAELATTKPVFDGPLYQQIFDSTQGNLPTVDRTDKNLFIKSWWGDLIGHLTWAFYCKGPLWYFHIVTDERIRNVYVGNEQYKSKSYSRRNDEVSNNSLHDLIGGETYDLVVIRLGFLGYKNIAMPGALLEALRIREALHKPTWIVEEPNSVFGPGHFSFSEELADYIERRFEIVGMVLDPDKAVAPRGIQGISTLEDEGSISIEDGRPSPAQVVMPQPRIKVPRAFDEKPVASSSTGDSMMDQILGTGKPSWKGSSGSWKKGGRRGGGDE